jgi:hypothetical protein
VGLKKKVLETSVNLHKSSSHAYLSSEDHLTTSKVH